MPTETTTDLPQSPLPDPVQFAQAMSSAWERAQPMIEKYWENYSLDPATIGYDPSQITEIYAQYWEKMMENPEKMAEIHAGYMERWVTLWQDSMLRMLGEKEPGDCETVAAPEKGDRRFKAQEWEQNAVFDFLKQSYLLTCQWIDKSLEETNGISDDQRAKLSFYNRLFTGAMSPTNFVMTNPEVLKETIESGGQNLLRGLENLVGDLERGDGELRISMTDYNAFKLGENIAVTPGKVVYQNDLMQLIQYEPTTEQVHQRPLLIVPPWINKYYILDLREDNSFVRWAVSQGHTVFMVSWVNPNKNHSDKRFEEYMQEGIVDALDQIKAITNEPDCNVVGYCLGGTLLTMTLSWMQTHGQIDRVASATFLTTLIDFEHAGEMKIFMDDNQLAIMERAMQNQGVLDGKVLQKTFSLLRANDLIWSFVINNYLMGKEPFPFDLLYWNDDSTNMPAAMHSFYLRKLYRDNLLCKPEGIEMDGTPIDVTKIDTPAYFLSTRDDHIAPWKATYDGAKLFSGPKLFTLAASGHIAGVVNAPEKHKYCYWTADDMPVKADNWLDKAEQHDGSWWPHWHEWMGQYTGQMVKARKIDKAIEDAPGSYVRMAS